MVCSFKKLLHFVYPPLCLHCRALLPDAVPVLCPLCLEQLSLATSDERCLTCFSSLEKGRCDTCSHRSVLIRKQLAATEKRGPAAILYARLLRGDPAVLAPMGALMAYQWLEHQLPLPDVMVSLPSFTWQSVDAARLLAEEVGRIFSVPIECVLKKRWDRHAFLNQGVFQACFAMKRKAEQKVCDKKVLLIAPLLDDALLRKAAEALQPYFPQQIYALTACV